VKRDLRRVLAKRLGQQLATKGFSPHGVHFVRQHAQTTDRFTVLCTDAKPGYWVKPHVALRIERVERIFHQTSGFSPEHQDTVTLGGSVGDILGGNMSDARFLLESDGQLDSLVATLLGLFHTVALPYYQRWSSLHAIDAELNDDPTVRSPHRGGPPLWRCSTGIIVAKLVQRPDYGALAQYYADVMRRVSNGFYYAQYQALLASLESVEPTEPPPAPPIPPQ
jgi:hypothetical protein